MILSFLTFSKINMTDSTSQEIKSSSLILSITPTLLPLTELWEVMRGLSIFRKNLLFKHSQVLINISDLNQQKIRKRTSLLLTFRWILSGLEVLILSWLTCSEELLLPGDYLILLYKNMELNILKGFSFTDLQELEKLWLPGNLQKLSRRSLSIL